MALTSAEISLPSGPDASRVRDRIAALADTVDLVGLTDNHAGQPRMSPLAAVALAREQGVATVVHISCRDRNRLALQSQVVGAAALGSEGVLCLYGDPVEGVPRVKDLTATALIAEAKAWAAPRDLAVGAVVNPFAADIEREIRLLEKKVASGADFLQTQMIFDIVAFQQFLEQTADLLAGFACTREWRCSATSEWPITLERCRGACCQMQRTDRSAWAQAWNSRRTWRANSRRSQESTHSTSFRSVGETETGGVASAFRAARGVPARRR